MRQLLNEMMKVNEDDMTDVPVEQSAPVEITPELMASLVEQMPELADIDQEELEKGIKVEMEHYDTVGGDMLLVAKIAVDHIRETPAGKSYYDALEAMEHELQETPEEEEAEEGPDDVDVDVPSEDMPMENVEEKKHNPKNFYLAEVEDVGQDLKVMVTSDMERWVGTLSYQEPGVDFEFGDENVEEGKDNPGVRDGTGPAKRSPRAGEKGVRKASGEKCPNVKESVSGDEPAETATNEEAQEMIDKGEAEIPKEAVVTGEEATKE